MEFMKPETLEAIKNMTGEFAKELSKFIDSKDTIKMSNNGINGVITGIFTKHITKYAELLEKSQEDIEILRHSLAHETTQRIFDNEKSEKLVDALNSLVLSVKAHPDYTGEENDEWTDLVEIAEELLTEYKTTSK